MFILSFRMPIEYLVLLHHHAAYYRQPPPVVEQNAAGQWSCSYMGDWVTIVPSSHPHGRNEAARLMWVVARIRQPLPRP
jgi:hypothetical protein